MCTDTQTSLYMYWTYVCTSEDCLSVYSAARYCMRGWEQLLAPLRACVRAHMSLYACVRFEWNVTSCWHWAPWRNAANWLRFAGAFQRFASFLVSLDALMKTEEYKRLECARATTTAWRAKKYAEKGTHVKSWSGKKKEKKKSELLRRLMALSARWIIRLT